VPQSVTKTKVYQHRYRATEQTRYVCDGDELDRRPLCRDEVRQLREPVAG
jgi:hypothetical protein